MLYEDQGFLEIIGQIIIGGFFIIMGIHNFLAPDMLIKRLEGYKIPGARLAIYSGIFMMLLGGSLILLDYYTKYGAIINLIFTISATAIFQRWWTISDPVRRPYHFMLFFYNIFIIGVMLMIIALN